MIPPFHLIMSLLRHMQTLPLYQKIVSIPQQILQAPVTEMEEQFRVGFGIMATDLPLETDKRLVILMLHQVPKQSNIGLKQM